MKIKTKKQFTLPQLIEWAFNNPKEVESKIFESDNIDYFSNTAHVQFSNDGCGVRLSSSVTVDDTFTVTTEEEITEDTVIPKMLVIGRFDGYEEVYNRKISHFNQHLLSAYIIHDDGHMELIYDEVKGLVG
ncbi:hypothetical protein WGPJNHAJ_CDS0097 [Staphylococcus phage PG-2021_19]